MISIPLSDESFIGGLDLALGYQLLMKVLFFIVLYPCALHWDVTWWYIGKIWDVMPPIVLANGIGESYFQWGAPGYNPMKKEHLHQKFAAYLAQFIPLSFWSNLADYWFFWPTDFNQICPIWPDISVIS